MEKWAQDHKRVVSRDKNSFREAVTKKELGFAKMLRLGKIDLGTHLKQEDKWQDSANRWQIKSKLTS